MIELAVPEHYAAEANGLSERLFRYWMNLGQTGTAPEYIEFFSAITRARAKAVANMHVRALSGGKGSQAAQFFLERRWNKEYGQRQRLDVNATNDPLAGLSDAELDAAISEHEALLAEFDNTAKDNKAAQPALPGE